MRKETKDYLIASSILIGSCIGAGVLGIPYIASKSGFFTTLFYIFFIGLIILLSNLYLGEVALRTKENHQLSGYAEKYLGKKGKKIMDFAFIFGIYASIVAYLIGMGDSLSYLIFGNLLHAIPLGILAGFVMIFLLWKGVGALKKFEKLGVFIILFLLILILILFIPQVDFSNLGYNNFENFLLPFGVVLFALLSFSAIPQVAYVLRNRKKVLKKSIITGSVISIVFYVLFAFVVVGFMGINTPEVATLALGSIFIFLGIFTIFTSHLSVGNALEENFEFDDGVSKKSSWFLASIIPMIIYILISFFPFFSFTKVLSIGGVVSGGIIAILIMFIVKRAKEKGERKPEYSIPLNLGIIVFLFLIFIFGILKEIFSFSILF